MKGYQRRAIGRESYCNLDVWDVRQCCWVKTKNQYENEEAARQAAKKPGRYRISKNENGSRIELAPFFQPPTPAEPLR